MSQAQQTEFQINLEHLVKLATSPGWKAYSWHRAQELERESPAMLRGLAQALKSRMTQAQDAGPA